MLVASVIIAAASSIVSAATDLTANAQSGLALIQSIPSCASSCANDNNWPGYDAFKKSGSVADFVKTCSSLAWGQVNIEVCSNANPLFQSPTNLTKCTDSDFSKFGAIADKIVPVCIESMVATSPIPVNFGDTYMVDYLFLPACASPCGNSTYIPGFDRLLEAFSATIADPPINVSYTKISAQNDAFAAVCKSYDTTKLDQCIASSCSSSADDLATAKTWSNKSAGYCSDFNSMTPFFKDVNSVYMGIMSLPLCARNQCAATDANFATGSNFFLYNLQTPEAFNSVCGTYDLNKFETCFKNTTLGCTADEIQQYQAFETTFVATCSKYANSSAATATVAVSAATTVKAAAQTTVVKATSFANIAGLSFVIGIVSVLSL